MSPEIQSAIFTRRRRVIAGASGRSIELGPPKSAPDRVSAGCPMVLIAPASATSCQAKPLYFSGFGRRDRSLPHARLFGTEHLGL